ncbi:MAG: hypothetical protein AB8H03_10445 [Saprospiraceae bacterium]
MKTLTFLISFFLLANIGFAQDHPILRIYSACKVGEFPRKNLMTVVSMTKDSIPELLEVIKNSKNDPSDYFYLLSFYHSTSNKEYWKLMDSIIMEGKINIAAAQRIGGNPFDILLTNYFSQDRELSSTILHTAWMVNGFDDLKILEKHAKDVLQNHTDWNMYKYISVTYIHILETVHSVFENGNNDLAFNLLTDLIENGNLYFNSGKESLLFAWAMKRFFITDFDKTKKIIFLKKLKDKYAQYGFGYRSLTIVYYLYLLGEEPNERETEFLKKSHYIIPTQNFNSSEELMDFFDFCKKYCPVGRIYNHY